MPTRPSVRLTPRRVPEQGRSRALVDSLLDATGKVLLEIGFEQANTTEIARVAGASVGSLYQYFPNKESLTAALLVRLEDDGLSYVAENVLEGRGLDLEDLSYLVALALVKIYADDRALWPIVLAAESRVGMGSKREAIEAKWHELFRGLLVASAPSRVPDRGHTRAFFMRRALRGLLEGVVSERPALLDDDALPDMLTELIWSGLRPRG